MPARSSVTPASRARLRATSGSAKRRQRERHPMTSTASTKSFQRVGPSSRTVQVDGTPVDLAEGDPNGNFPPIADIRPLVQPETPMKIALLILGLLALLMGLLW